MQTLDELYNEHYHELTDNDIYIFDYVMKHYDEISNMSITQLAKKISISKSTILRFTQKIGFSGFSEFKYYLSDYSRLMKSVDNTEDSKQVLMKDIETSSNLYQNSNIEEIIEVIYHCNNLFCYGTGWGQKNVINDFKRNLVVCHKIAIEISAATELAIMSTSIKEGDVLLIISLSGNVSNIEKEIMAFKSRGAVIIAITRIGDSLLAKLSDHTIYFSSTGLQFRGKEVVSFTPIHYVVSLLFYDYFDYYKNKNGM